ncbi:MAG TPA: hypothetical protein VJW75_01495 [Candidatus Eisenbacteria bacterium]|nr:hypothetical protein [Candidatus Eisenbacteria bacterium]
MNATTHNEPLAPDTGHTASSLHWVLRIGVFACFLGHGSFAIMAKPEWANFFGVVGVPSDVALHVLPWIGLLDLTVAALALASPRPFVFLWAAMWCLWTASLRPLTGLGMWEFWVRAGNYGIPLAFLAVLPWPRTLREWVEPIAHGPVTAERLRLSGSILRIAIALALIGHAGLGVFQRKAGLLEMYAKVGLPSSVEGIPLAVAIGWFELALAAAVLIKPFRTLLVFVCVYKVMMGLLHPASGAYWWEFIERGADYMAPIALILVGDALVAERARIRARTPVAEALSTAPVSQR